MSNLINLLIKKGLTFVTGVPDTTLKEIIEKIEANDEIKHIIATDEGEAMGIACGYHLATGKTPVVYLQSDGLCNAINPIVSLFNVYKIPAILLIGWRGLDNDAIQHKKMGSILLKQLELLGIEYKVVDKEVRLPKDIDLKIKPNNITALIFRKSDFPKKQ